MTERHRIRFQTRLGLLLLGACWLAIEAPTIRHGCDLTDFGRSATVAHRLAHSDRPFLDASGNVASLAEYYASWLFRLEPEATLLDLRIVDSIVQFVAFVAVYLVLARVTTPLKALVGTAVSMPIVKIWFTQALAYHTVPATFAILSIATFWAAMNSHRRGTRYAVAGIAGVLGVAAATSRLPHVGMVALPAVALLSAHVARSRWREALQSTTVYVLAFVATTALVAGLIHYAGLGDVVVQRFRLAFSGYGGATRLGFFWEGMRESVAAAVISANCLALCALLMSNTLARLPRWLRVFMALGVAATYTHYLHVQSGCETRLLGFGFVGVTAGLIAFWPRHDQNEPQRRAAMDRTFLYLTSVFIVLLSMVGSNTGTSAAIRGAHYLIALSVILVIELPGHLPCLGKAWFVEPVLNRVVPGSIVAAVVLASASWYLVYGSYRDLYAFSRPDCHVPFKSARLAGITSAPQRVELIDKLVEYVQERVEPGGLILAYYDVPLLYFATDTRPAPFITWILENRPASLEQAVLDDMIQRGRIPELVIRNTVFPSREWPDFGVSESKKAYTHETYSSDDPERRPINAWVDANYALTKRIGPLEIWSPKDEGVVLTGAEEQSAVLMDQPL
ncbi:MAG: hypothetical protein JXQ75_05165 [Phycisphaerae bacterium]|nr:hypothetical protein [Phycisphaerae bacterium]